MRSTCIFGVAGMMAATVAGLGIPKAGLIGRQVANDNIVYITEYANSLTFFPRRSRLN